MSDPSAVDAGVGEVVLTRAVRLCLSGDPAQLNAPRHNTFSAWPPMRGLGRYYEVQLTCRGRPDPVTGYFINIREMDAAVREACLPILWELTCGPAAQAAEVPMGALLHGLLGAVQAVLPPSAALCLNLCPTLGMTAFQEAPTMIEIRQQYSFAAAHRLHCDSLSEADNREVFGRCNNPNGHGHNYRMEVAVAAALDAQGRVMEPAAMDAWVDGAVVQKLDHQHLNQDVPAFAELNPSTEHIAKVIWEWLSESTPEGVALAEVVVWETEKTRCVYRGEVRNQS